VKRTHLHTGLRLPPLIRSAPWSGERPGSPFACPLVLVVSRHMRLMLRFSVAVAIIAVLGLAGVVSLKQQRGPQLWWLCAARLVNAASFALLYAG